MATFFEQVSKSFADVPISADNEIDTVAFLAATEDLIKLFDFLNATAFAPKIRERFNKDPAKYVTLQRIVKDEAPLSNKKERVGTEGLMWLRRLALRRNLSDPTEELNVSFSKAYEATLQKFHNMFIRPIFYLALKAVPNRETFYKKIGGDDINATLALLEPWLAGLEKCINILVAFYTEGKYEW